MEEHSKQYILDIYNILQQNIIVSYTGPFDGGVLTTIGNNIEYALRDNPQAGKRIFKIFVELAQNISFYSAETVLASDGHTSGVGILLLREFDDHFVLYTGNITDKKGVEAVSEKCDAIRNMDREGLREFKRQKRSLPQGEHGAGNIGLIQVALSADGAINYKITKFTDEEYFFTLAVPIQK